ncbi:MAG: aminopeptidase [Bacilli bacterium]
MDEKIIDSYADLIVKVGANVQKGQYVVIRTSPCVEEFASLVAKKCYERGAKRVFVHWISSYLNKVDYEEATTEELSSIPAFEEECHKFMADNCPILIWLDADDPDGLKGVDSKKVAAIRAAKNKVLGKYRDARDNKSQWCIAGVPSKEWATKVFPSLSEEDAIEALWKAILTTARALDGNGIKNWEDHEKDLKKRCSYLNSLNLRKLHYESKTGTDFTVGLIPGVIFLGGGEKDLSNRFFQPNIPSEESFTSPMKGEAEGIVVASKPLAYNGQLIEDFTVRFHEGKAVEVTAKKGLEALQGILTLDEGSAYLGECALVPFDSPINNTGILFLNTLYDENAACHLALGTGFPSLYPNFEKYTPEEIQKFGINKSHSHVDFMIGDRYLNITGTTIDGKEIPIFRNGNWSF